MACLHKFHQYLNLEGLDFEPTTLIVGTFNPAWPDGNNAQWFYGRTQNNYFWDVLPRIYHPDINLRNATPDEWKAFCSNNGIALTDMVSSIQDAHEAIDEHRQVLGNYLDTSIADYFGQFMFTEIVEILINNPTIENIYFTRQPGIPLFDELWNSVVQYGEENNKRVRSLLTPSASARFQIGPYKLANPDDPTPLRNFIYQSWLQEWHHI